ncbi:hypothetical protein [Nitrosospira sp. NRS527]|uniref:hypothetical protein n=1 Tax=Nitrosospira sp. NRS527 TaxID=155925 RepID=UPI001AF612C1|nr:hypothetical protein [Nitrosospira sp. NRS527]BCT69512.1 hypothetical protein NNRS527_03137 [Nitrosospira sp. NRS527]
MKTIALMMCVLSLTGCAALQAKLEAIAAKSTPGSYLAPDISDTDADEVAMDVAQFLSAQLLAAKTTLELQSSENKLHLTLLDQLMVKGFGVIQSKQPTEQQSAVQLRYKVTPLYKGVLVRLRYGGQEASRFFDRANDGHLSLHTRYAVREATK